jgi:hypothetical protein
LLFAAHAAHADAVTWISGRTDVLAAGFVLGALVLHRRGSWVMAALAFAGGLLSKETAICFPLLVVVGDWLAPPRRRSVAAVAAYFALLLPYAWVRYVSTDVFASALFGTAALAYRSSPEVVSNVTLQTARAARFLLAPLPLSGWIAVPAVALLSGFGLWVSRRADARPHRRTHHATPLLLEREGGCSSSPSLSKRGGQGVSSIYLAAAWVAIACLPILPLTWAAERYVYLATVGWVTLLVLIGKRIWELCAARPLLRLAFVTVAAGWFVFSVVGLQRANERLRRNGLLSARLIDAVAEVVPRPQPRTVFVLEGLAQLGALPSIRHPVMLFGMSEALRLRFDEPRLDAVYPEVRPAPFIDGTRPIVRLRWDGEANRFAVRPAPQTP